MDEDVGRTRLLELGRQVRQLGEDFVDQPDGGCKLVGVDILCEKATDVAWGRSQRRGVEELGELHTQASDDQHGRLAGGIGDAVRVGCGHDTMLSQG